MRRSNLKVLVVFGSFMKAAFRRMVFGRLLLVLVLVTRSGSFVNQFCLAMTLFSFPLELVELTLSHKINTSRSFKSQVQARFSKVPPGFADARSKQAFCASPSS